MSACLKANFRGERLVDRLCACAPLPTKLVNEKFHRYSRKVVQMLGAYFVTGCRVSSEPGANVNCACGRC